MNRIAILLACLAAAPSAFAQTPAQQSMTGMKMQAALAGGAEAQQVHDPATMEKPAVPDASDEEDILVPESPPPPPPNDRAADRFYDPKAMQAAYEQLKKEHGGTLVSKLMINIAEYQARGDGGYRWDGEAWFGGDLNRFVAKSEGEGDAREGLDTGEVQALFSRAVGPYTDLQLGLRQDFGTRSSRTYAALSAETLLPYWFEVQAAAFLSTKGELLARLEATYDLFVTQRLILQPRAELNFAGRDSPDMAVGSGLSNAELGLRLRYDIRRTFSPYIGVSFDRKVGTTADYARTAGRDVSATSFVIGLRTFF